MEGRWDEENWLFRMRIYSLMGEIACMHVYSGRLERTFVSQPAAGRPGIERGEHTQVDDMLTVSLIATTWP